MRVPILWRLAQALVLTGLIVGAATGLAAPVTPSLYPTALASVAAYHDDNDNDDGDNGDNGDNDNDNDDNDNDDEARVLRGQVVSPAPGVLPAIDRNLNPPVMFVANIDGIVTVPVLDPPDLDASGVQPGDHVRLDGRKITEFLFEATDIEVTERCCPAPQAADDDGDDNENGDDDDEDDNDNEDEDEDDNENEDGNENGNED